MQCRNAVRQHVGAAISPAKTNAYLPHLWISDEQLNEAFTRFVRVSHTTRRYGSNVPGPLEARRRQTRRRMGFVSQGMSESASISEFGALFGPGHHEPGHHNPGTFTWEPPSQRVPEYNSESTRPAENAWSRLWHTSQSTSDSRQCKPGHQQDQEAEKTNISHVGAVEAKKSRMTQYENEVASKTAFEALIQAHEERDKLTTEDIAPMLAFLESTQDEPEAGNLQTLLYWMQDQKLCDARFKAVRALVISKHQLKTLSTSKFKSLLPSLIKLAIQNHGHNSADTYLDSLSVLSDHIKAEVELAPEDEELRKLYKQLFTYTAPRTATFEECCSALQALAVMAQKRDAVNVRGGLVARAFARILTKLPYGQEAQSSQLEQLEALFVQVLDTTEEKELAPRVMHLFLDPSKRTATSSVTRARVSFWLKCLHQSQQFCPKQSKGSLVAAWSTYRILGTHYVPFDIARHLARLSRTNLATALLIGWSGVSSLPAAAPSLTSAAAGTVHRTVDQWRPQLDKRHTKFLEELQQTHLPDVQDPLLSLLSFIQRNGGQHNKMLAYVFAIYDAGKYDVLARLRFYTRIQQDLQLSMPVEMQAKMINCLMERGQTLQALRCLLESPEVSLTAVKELPRVLVSLKYDTDFVINTIENKLALRRSGKRVWPLQQNTIDLVLQVASLTARSDSITAATAFTSVWRCYRFLKDRDVKLDSTISQALSHSGIIRPLHGNGTLPDSRIRYIVRLVRHYEGEGIADGLWQMTKAYRSQQAVRRPDQQRIGCHIEDTRPRHCPLRKIPNF